MNAVNYVDQIRDGLIQADPAGKDIYTRNADAYIVKLQALDQWVKNQVSQLPVEKRLLVTNHDALGYFAKAYDFKVVGAIIPSVTTDASPSAQQLAGLIDTIKRSGAPAIFLDIGENQNLAQQIASETGVKVITDLYVESTSGPNGPAPTYIDMIKHDITRNCGCLKIIWKLFRNLQPAWMLIISPLPITVHLCCGKSLFRFRMEHAWRWSARTAPENPPCSKHSWDSCRCEREKFSSMTCRSGTTWTALLTSLNARKWIGISRSRCRMWS